jgi:hypothetical protein
MVFGRAGASVLLGVPPSRRPLAEARENRIQRPHTLNPLFKAAVDDISAAILANLQAKHPGGKARFDDIRTVVADLCAEFGQPGTVSVREENGRAIFVMSDAMKVLLMAVAMKAAR